MIQPFGQQKSSALSLTTTTSTILSGFSESFIPQTHPEFHLGNDKLATSPASSKADDASHNSFSSMTSMNLLPGLSDIVLPLNKSSIDSSPASLSKKIVTIVYGINYSNDQFDIPAQQAHSKSRYLAGLLYSSVSRFISISVPDTTIFRSYFVPYFLYLQLPMFATMPSETVIKCSALAEFLGMDEMLLRARETLAISLERHMKIQEFNPSLISKQELLNIFSIQAIQLVNRTPRESTTFRLRALLYWLNDSSESDAIEMNKWFSAKCKCSWVLHVVTGNQKEFGDLRHELRDEMDKFFVCPASIMASMTARIYLAKPKLNQF